MKPKGDHRLISEVKNGKGNNDWTKRQEGERRVPGARGQAEGRKSGGR
jgi:hypothetical protein